MGPFLTLVTLHTGISAKPPKAADYISQQSFLSHKGFQRLVYFFASKKSSLCSCWSYMDRWTDEIRHRSGVKKNYFKHMPGLHNMCRTECAGKAAKGAAKWIIYCSTLRKERKLITMAEGGKKTQNMRMCQRRVLWSCKCSSGDRGFWKCFTSGVRRREPAWWKSSLCADVFIQAALASRG